MYVLSLQIIAKNHPRVIGIRDTESVQVRHSSTVQCTCMYMYILCIVLYTEKKGEVVVHKEHFCCLYRSFKRSWEIPEE